MEASHRNFIKHGGGLSWEYSCWLRAYLGLALCMHPEASLCAALACVFDEVHLQRRDSFTNSTFALLAVQSLLSWFWLFASVSVGSNWLVAIFLSSPVCPVSSLSANAEHLWEWRLHRRQQSLLTCVFQAFSSGENRLSVIIITSSYLPFWPILPSHSSCETRTGLEDKLWKREQANTLESQESFSLAAFLRLV